MPMRQDCKYFESRSYPNGDTVRKCDLDLAPEAPWRCPEDCPSYTRRMVDVNWSHGTLVTPATPDEPASLGEDDSIAALPEGPLFLLANEFFDALPVRQFLRVGDAWAERVVGLQDGALSFGLTEPAAQAALSHRLDDTAEGDLVETCSPALGISEEIGRRIAAHGGAALVVDYGSARSLGDTFQALRRHEKVDPLAYPGESDLTAHVDFGALAEAAPCAHSALTPQGVFLERLGITDRARALAAKLSGEALDSHVAAHRRLTHPDEMGSLFKTLGFFPEGATPPPGLQT